MIKYLKADDEGLHHCEDGPAVVYNDGSYSYYIHGKLHRLDGPAVSIVCSTETYLSWYLNGKHIDVKSQEEFLRLINLKLFW